MKVTATKTFNNNNFDLLRILAATQVLALHTILHLHLTRPHGYSVFEAFQGVPMFFAISGYLISASYERNAGLKNYFKNRFFRIYPALWFVVILTVITASIVGGISFLNTHAIVWFFSQLAGVIYTPAFLKPYGIGSYNGSLWTIPIELQFYIVLPVIYFFASKLFAKKPNSNQPFYIAWFLFLILAFYLWSAFPGMYTDTVLDAAKVIRYSFLPHFYIFLCGVILQRLSASTNPLIEGKGLYWVAAFLLFTYLVPHSTFYTIFSLLLLGILTISLAYTLPGIATKLLKGNDISYGVYIYHGLIVNIFVQLGLIGHYKYLAMIMAITYVLAFISWKLIEKPMLRRKKKTINLQLSKDDEPEFDIKLKTV